VKEKVTELKEKIEGLGEQVVCSPFHSSSFQEVLMHFRLFL
jgi:hypothetical protein